MMCLTQNHSPEACPLDAGCCFCFEQNSEELCRYLEKSFGLFYLKLQNWPTFLTTTFKDVVQLGLSSLSHIYLISSIKGSTLQSASQRERWTEKMITDLLSIV